MVDAFEGQVVPLGAQPLREAQRWGERQQHREQGRSWWLALTLRLPTLWSPPAHNSY